MPEGAEQGVPQINLIGSSAIYLPLYSRMIKDIIMRDFAQQSTTARDHCRPYASQVCCLLAHTNVTPGFERKVSPCWLL